MSEAPGTPAQPAVGLNQSATGVAEEPGDASTATAPSLVLTEPVQSIDAAEAAAQPAQSPPPRGVDKVKPLDTRRLPDPSKVNGGWWVLAILILALAIVSSTVVARGTAFNHGHRLAVAGASLLDVLALATLAHVVLLWYQSRITPGRAASPELETLNFRRRGLKAAVIGRDGRASTSKAQVVLWTGAVVWALINLLLLARSYPSGNLFTGAVTSNWRPEYLVLLGLPIAAAATAKAVVSGSNSGQGPVAHSQLAAVRDQRSVYVRDPIQAWVKGFGPGVAELITADDGTAAWPDLQYVVFTLITLVYFVVQVLAQPLHGLPPVPAALLTLMGVSASGYTASKIVETKRTASPQGQQQTTVG